MSMMSANIARSRREWMALSAATGAAQSRSGEKIRIGFIGVGSRGTDLLKNLLARADGNVPAAFDKGPDDYRRLFARTDVQAILIATPQEEHARMSRSTR